jgi:hypothetical protein
MTDNRQCLEFWYFMYGSNVGTLSVGKVANLLTQVRWTTSGGKGYEWYHAQVNVQSSTMNPTQFNVGFFPFLEEKLLIDFFSCLIFSLLLKVHGPKIIVDQ